MTSRTNQHVEEISDLRVNGWRTISNLLETCFELMDEMEQVWSELRLSNTQDPEIAAEGLSRSGLDEDVEGALNSFYFHLRDALEALEIVQITGCDLKPVKLRLDQRNPYGVEINLTCWNYYQAGITLAYRYFEMLLAMCRVLRIKVPTVVQKNYLLHMQAEILDVNIVNLREACALMFTLMNPIRDGLEKEVRRAEAQARERAARVDISDWLSVTAAANRLVKKSLGLIEEEEAPAMISRGCANGTIRSVGTRRMRRVDPASVDAYALKVRDDDLRKADKNNG